jgi:hypothetical protein
VADVRGRKGNVPLSVRVWNWLCFVAAYGVNTISLLTDDTPRPDVSLLAIEAFSMTIFEAVPAFALQRWMSPPPRAYHVCTLLLSLLIAYGRSH